jgi:GNAT superfamily N-acetyltransferase
MIYREATINDVGQMQIVRNTVKENVLSNPLLVPDKDVEDYIMNRGKGWVCVMDETVLGFSIVSVQDKNVWALFVRPDFERKGIGKQLHRLMMNWYFQQTKETIWLSTAPASRAETFYRMNGWKETGVYGKGEIKFEMDVDTWNNIKKLNSNIKPEETL